MGSALSRWGAWVLTNRRAVRAPIWLYRHRLGWLLGPRILMVEHVGRTTGRARFVCLEVVEHPRPERYVVVSGFGERAQWYRNLLAHPACRISTGTRRRRSATARLMDATESGAVLARYQARHHLAWRQLRGTIERATGRPVTTLPMVELTVTSGLGPQVSPPKK